MTIQAATRHLHREWGLAIRLLCAVLWPLGASVASQYSLDLRADRSLNVRGVETLVWRNDAANPSSEIPVYCTCAISRIVEGKNQLRIRGQRIVLSAPVLPGNTVAVRIEFAAKARSAYGYRMLAGAWHPKAGTVRNGQFTSAQPVDNYEVTLTAPADLIVASSGKSIDKPVTAGAERRSQWRLENVTSFGLAASSNFVETLRESGGVEVRLYQLRGDSRFNAAIADYATDVIRFYKALFGFYPHPAIVMLPGSYKSGGGYSPASGFAVFHKITGEFFERGYAAHEIGHQYWGFDTVLDVGEPCHWLGLGLGTYSDNLYMSSKGLSSVVGLSKYREAAAKGFNTSLRQAPEQMRALKFDWNGAVCHSKSYAVMRMLADLMGPEQWLQFLRTLLDRYRYKHLSYEEFRTQAQAAAGQELGWFFHDWVDTNGAADYAIESVRRTGDTVEVGISRAGTARFPISVRLSAADGSHQVKRIAINPATQTITFATQHDPVRVELDPAGICPLMKNGNEIWTPR